MRKFLLTGLVSVAAFGHCFAEVVVQDAWIRPSSGPNGALFMVLKNTGSEVDSLMSAKAESGQCDHMELHNHIEQDGKMMMRQVEVIDVPAGQETKLQPGGMHVMLMGLKKPLKAGDVVPISLNFKGGSSQTLSVTVKNPAETAEATPGKVITTEPTKG